MLRKWKKNNQIVSNQLQSKLLLKNTYDKTLVKSTRLNVNFHKLRSFNDDLVLEGLFFLEFIGGLKANISYYKKMYQEVNLQVSTVLRKSFISYFMMLLKLFYFPLLNRRSLYLTEAFDKNNQYYFTVTNVNSFLFLPDIYFKWNTPVNCFIQFSKKDYNVNKLLLQYNNFPVLK